nr:MAG TPA: hypothetical protein [Caudoviricetes sp.]
MVNLPRLANLGLLCGFGSIVSINFIISFKIHQPNLKCVRKMAWLVKSFTSFVQV